jgi:putative endonuclease
MTAESKLRLPWGDLATLETNTTLSYLKQGLFSIKMKYNGSMEKRYFAYILECSDGTLYCGSTNNLEKRIHEHNNSKNGAHYTKIRRPVVLKYFESFETYAEVRKREAEIKRLSREEKMKLI